MLTLYIVKYSKEQNCLLQPKGLSEIMLKADECPDKKTN